LSQTNEKMKRKPKKSEPAKLPAEIAAPGHGRISPTRALVHRRVDGDDPASWCFGTATLLQAFVVPTSSMEDTVLIGDHMIVDKLAFSPHSATRLSAAVHRGEARGHSSSSNTR